MNIPGPRGEGAGMSRRRVLIGAAWVTPAVLIATGSPPAAASPDNPLENTDIIVIESGNDDTYLVTVRLPDGTVLTGATLAIVWQPGGGAGAGVDVSTGGTLWSPGVSSAASVTFTAPGPIADDSQFQIHFNKGVNGSAWTGLLSGMVGTTSGSKELSGTL